MKVFVSSTCYDLIDLRTELYEELRDLGVEAKFSDLKESDFRVPSEPDVNSIEACLANVRDSDLVIVILSQRYGRPLPPPFRPVSATHHEYEEAKTSNKPIWFYVRDRLEADYASWYRNADKEIEPVWAHSKSDAGGLFSMIKNHRRLVDAQGEASKNNWFGIFQTSKDLRADIRRRLAPEAYHATAERLVEEGQVPIILTVRPQVENKPHGETLLKFMLVNAGPIPAVNVAGTMDFGGGNIFAGNHAKIVTVLPGGDGGKRICFLVPNQFFSAIAAERKQPDGSFYCDLLVSYTTPSGHILEDCTRLHLKFGDQKHFVSSPAYIGKTVGGKTNFIRNSRLTLRTVIEGRSGLRATVED